MNKYDPYPSQGQRPPLSTSPLARATLWFALLCGSSLFLSFFVALPMPLVLALVVLIGLCAVVLTVEEVTLAQRQSQQRSGWRAVGRFLKKFLLLLP